MKKLILIILLLFAVSSQAQIDTANWSLKFNNIDGKYSLLTNRTEIAGVSAGGIVIPIIFSANQIDTSLFQLLPNQTNGKYSIATNRGVLYGVDTNEIKVAVMYDMGGVNVNAPYIWTRMQTMDSLTVNYLVGSISDTSMTTIVPGADSTYDIGTSTVSWKDAYIDGYVYLAGNATTDGSWRFYANLNGDMIFETRVSGTWTEKSRITK